MANRTKLTPEKRQAFLDVLRQCANVSEAARSIAVTRQRIYELRDEDADFAAAWADAVEEGVDKLEREMWRRAVEGTDEPVFYQGVECGSIKRYSDTLAIFLAKGHRPEKYKERTEFSGDPKRPLHLTVTEISEERLLQIAGGGK